MANRERGEIAVKVGEQDYILRPTFDSICELETLTGKSIDDLFGDISVGKMSGLRSTVWCLLQDKHGEEIRSLKDASEWIERAGGVEVVLAALADVRDLNTEASTQKASAEGNPRKARAGTGRRSLKALAKSA